VGGIFGARRVLSVNGDTALYGLSRLNLLRFGTAFAGLTATGFAIWNHDLVLIIMGVVLGGIAQFFNLVRHTKNGNTNVKYSAVPLEGVGAKP
jgi:hypothetical protein